METTQHQDMKNPGFEPFQDLAIFGEIINYIACIQSYKVSFVNLHKTKASFICIQLRIIPS